MSIPLLSQLQCRRLYQAISPKAPILRHRGAQALTQAIPPNTAPLRRASHTSRPRSLRRSPRVRNTSAVIPARWVAKGRLPIDAEGFVNAHITSDVGPVLQLFDLMKHDLYTHGQEQYKYLPPGISFATFEEVCTKIITAAHSKPPTAQNVRAISVDVDAVYRILCTLSIAASEQVILQEVHRWAETACARAGSRRAVVRIVQGYLQIPSVDVYQNTECIAKVKDLALKDKFPPAIALYSRLLVWRGEYTTAIELLEKEMLPYIKPGNRPPPSLEMVTLGPEQESPLRVYGLAIAETQGVEAMRKVTERSALEFREPLALTDLAVLQIETEDWDLYEHYMAMAAMHNHGPACLYLANFYYRVSLGEFPTQEERQSKKQAESPTTLPWLEKAQSTFESFQKKFNPPMAREDYRKAAMDWYELAFESDQTEAGFIMAMLLREEGQTYLSRDLYNLAVQKGLPTTISKKGLLQMEEKWMDTNFNPGVPPKLLMLG